MKFSNYLFFVSLFFLFAQTVFAQKYAKISRNGDYSLNGDPNKKVKLFEGEIFEIGIDDVEPNKLKNGKKGILIKFGESSIELAWGSGNKQTYEYPVRFDPDTFETLRTNMDKYVQRSQDSINYLFDFGGLQTNEAIFVASYEVKDVVKIKTVKQTTITQTYFDRHFKDRHLRVIVAGYPSLIYNSKNIIFSQKTAVQANSDTESSGNWKYIIGVVLLVLAAIFAILNKDSLFKTSPEIRTKDGRNEKPEEKPMTIGNREIRHETRKQNVPKQQNVAPEKNWFDDLVSVFKPSKKEEKEENNLDSEQKPEEKVEQKITIKEETEIAKEEVVEQKVEGKPKEPTKIPENVSNSMVWQVKQLKNEVKELSLTNEELLKNNLDLENKLDEQKEINAKLLAELTESLEQEIEEKMPINPVIPNETELIDPQQEAFFQLHSSSLKKYAQIEAKAKEFYQRSIKEEASAEKKMIELILFRYFLGKSTIFKIAEWESVLTNLQKSVRLANESWKAQLKDNVLREDAGKMMHESIVLEVHKPFLNVLLIMMEEMRNLERFTNMRFLLVDDIQSFFTDEIKTILNMAKFRLEQKINYVPLFTQRNRLEDDRIIKNVPLETLNTSSLYEGVKVENQEILAIKKYGFNEELSEVVLG